MSQGWRIARMIGEFGNSRRMTGRRTILSGFLSTRRTPGGSCTFFATRRQYFARTSSSCCALKCPSSVGYLTPKAVMSSSAFWMNGCSSMDCSSGCASRVNSSSVVPERGKATTNTGLSALDGALKSAQRIEGHRHGIQDAMALVRALEIRHQLNEQFQRELVPRLALCHDRLGDTQVHSESFGPGIGEQFPEQGSRLIDPVGALEQLNERQLRHQVVPLLGKRLAHGRFRALRLG